MCQNVIGKRDGFPSASSQKRGRYPTLTPVTIIFLIYPKWKCIRIGKKKKSKETISYIVYKNINIETMFFVFITVFLIVIST